MNKYIIPNKFKEVLVKPFYRIRDGQRTLVPAHSRKKPIRR